MTAVDKYRLISRSDFDGLVCAVLMKELDVIDDILFVHPKDVQDGKIEVDRWDILTNVPYVPGCHLAFDHHSSETLRLPGARPDNYIIDPEAPSAARVVYDYYGGEKTFPTVSPELIRAVDKADSAQFAREEILHPAGWVLLNFIMDARTGLGRFREFRVSNYQLMMALVDCCRTAGIDEILSQPDVRERVSLYFEHEESFKEQLRRCSSNHGELVTLDLRDEVPIFSGNRFMIYAMNPLASISMHILWGREKRNTVFAIGKSILNRTSKVDIGELCLQYGGGGHENAGTCQVPNSEAEAVLRDLVEKISGQADNFAQPVAQAG